MKMSQVFSLTGGGAIVLTAVAVALSGCAANGRESGSTQPLPDEPASHCLSVSAVAIEGLEWGLDDRQDGLDIARAVAIRNPSSELSWFVAAQIIGPGMGDNAVGVWSTIHDPTVDGTGAAFTSVDAMAAEFSSYVQPPGYSAALDGVDDVKACLNNE